MRIGIGLGRLGVAKNSVADQVNAIQAAETNGFASVWMPHTFGFDAMTLLAVAGQLTRTIELGTLVVPTYPRHPTAMAQQALTVSAATAGRFTLGIGVSHRLIIEDMLGLDFSKPIRHMREYLSVLIPALHGEAIACDGDEFRVSLQLDLPRGKAPQVIVAALGAQMLRLTGRFADGAATWMGGAKYLETTAVPAVTAAAMEAGRPAPRIVSGFPVAVTASIDEAKRVVAQKSGQFGKHGLMPSYRAALAVDGASDASGVAIVGDEETVARRVRQLRDVGVTDLVASLFDVPGDPDASTRTFGLLSEFAVGVI